MIKIIRETDIYTLEEKVNKFTVDRKVPDIKGYQYHFSGTGLSGYYHICVITYGL